MQLVQPQRTEGRSVMPKCSVCGRVLTGGSDTFGPIAIPLCQSHWHEAVDTGRMAIQNSDTLAASMGLPHMTVDEVEAGVMMLALGDDL